MTRPRPFAAIALALTCSGLQANEGPTAPPHITPIRWQFSAERLRLPGDEGLGLWGGSLLFDMEDGWAAGPAVYGAGHGQRGGLFVGGLAVQRRWALSPRWQAGAELYAGGGGGAGAPVGGGLMLRPAAQLLYALGHGFEAGLSLSEVRFPSGDIRSRQWGVVLGWADRFHHATPPDTPRAAVSWGSSGLGVARLAFTASQLALQDGSHRRIGTLGARAEWRNARGDWTWGVETAGAARGAASGYMEILGTAAWRIAPLPRAAPALKLGARAALGASGGGAVPTGGGLMARASALLEWQAPEWTFGVETGAVTGRAAGMRGRQTQLWVAHDLDPPSGTPARLLRTEWSLALQRYARAARTAGGESPLSTVGLKVSRQLGPHLYATGQAHSAYAGGAGAYSVGLAGVGIVQPLDARWRVGAEALAGAAGGGGVHTGGGALVQTLVWAGWAPGPAASEWRVGIGGLRSWHGDLRSPLFELSWTRAFGQTGY